VVFFGEAYNFEIAQVDSFPWMFVICCLMVLSNSLLGRDDIVVAGLCTLHRLVGGLVLVLRSLRSYRRATHGIEPRRCNRFVRVLHTSEQAGNLKWRIHIVDRLRMQ